MALLGNKPQYNMAGGVVPQQGQGFDMQGLLGNPLLHAGIGLLGSQKGQGAQAALQGAMQGQQIQQSFADRTKKAKDEAAQKAALAQMAQDPRYSSIAPLLGSPMGAQIGAQAAGDQFKSGLLQDKPVGPSWKVHPTTGQMYDANALEMPQVDQNLKPIIDKDLIKGEQELRVEFNKTIEPYRQTLDNHRQLVTSLTANGGIGDVAATYQFVKSLDPTSVVRESEFGIAANAGGILSRMNNLMEKHKDGKFLPPVVKQEMASLSQQFAEIAHQSAQQKREEYDYRVDRYKYDQRAVLGDPISSDIAKYAPQEAAAPSYAGQVDRTSVGLPRPTSTAEYDSIKSGEMFINTDGKPYRKP